MSGLKLRLGPRRGWLSVAIIIDAGAGCFVGGYDGGCGEVVGVVGVDGYFVHCAYDGCEDEVPVFGGVGVDAYFH